MPATAATGAIGQMAGNIGAGASGLISGITGFFQRKKGNKLLSENPYPTEAMPSEVLANQQIAQNQALQGMPSEQYDAAQKNIQRNQAAAISAASTNPGGAVRNIGAIQQASNDATGQLNAQSAEMRRQNIGQLMGVNSQVASWKDKLFDWNQRQRYIQNYNYAMGLVGQGNANMMSGVDKLLGAATGSAASGAFSGGNRGSASTGSAPAAYDYSPQLANTSGGSVSPASLFGNINPTAPNILFQ